MPPVPAKTIALAGVGLAAMASVGCSGLISSRLADTLAGTGTTWASDDDPELVRDAVPFALKTMEQVLDQQPAHVGLLAALARNFAQYGYAFPQQEADRLEEKDIAAAKGGHLRARRLYLRAREYGLRGLEVRHAGMRAALSGGKPAERDAALAKATKEDVPLLYWTAAPWALAVGVSKDDMRLVGELPVVEAMMARALALDESWDEGAIHEFYVAYATALPPSSGGGTRAARAHLERALALSQNKKLGPLVSFAEGVCVADQDKAEFTRLLEQVVATDVDRDPPHRLANLIAQRRARWLLDRKDDLFAE